MSVITGVFSKAISSVCVNNSSLHFTLCPPVSIRTFCTCGYTEHTISDVRESCVPFPPWPDLSFRWWSFLELDEFFSVGKEFNLSRSVHSFVLVEKKYPRPLFDEMCVCECFHAMCLYAHTDRDQKRMSSFWCCHILPYSSEADLSLILELMLVSIKPPNPSVTGVTCTYGHTKHLQEC